MDTASLPFTFWEALLFAFLNAFPYMLLVLRAFRSRWRFRRGATLGLLSAITVLQMAAAVLRLLCPVQNPLFDVGISLLYVLFIPLVIRDHMGKLAFTVLVMMDLGNLVVVLSKCVEGLLFPDLAALRYHFTYSLMMLGVEAVLLPLIYLLIFRDICPKEGEEESGAASRYLWRYLWMVPAVFYVIWMQHFYASGKSALENALDPVSTAYLLLIDTGSVLIYRVILQLARTTEKNSSLLAENHALSLQTVQYENLRKRIEEARVARHDLRHHVMLLKSIRDNRDLSALDALLAGYPDLETLGKPLVYCQNEMVSAILAHFGDQAGEKGIRYTVSLELPEDCFVEKPDLAVLFGNLLENALEACAADVPEPFISVSGGGGEGDGSLTLTVQNSCVGEPCPGNGGAYRSTKHSGDGIGIESVKRIAQRYGGLASFGAEGGVFTARVLLFKK